MLWSSAWARLDVLPKPTGQHSSLIQATLKGVSHNRLEMVKEQQCPSKNNTIKPTFCPILRGAKNIYLKVRYILLISDLTRDVQNQKEMKV